MAACIDAGCALAQSGWCACGPRHPAGWPIKAPCVCVVARHAPTHACAPSRDPPPRCRYVYIFTEFQVGLPPGPHPANSSQPGQSPVFDVPQLCKGAEEELLLGERQAAQRDRHPAAGQHDALLPLAHAIDRECRRSSQAAGVCLHPPTHTHTHGRGTYTRRTLGPGWRSVQQHCVFAHIA
jgi:hypothetical protein